MKDLDFLYNDDFVLLLKDHTNIDQYSIIPNVEKLLIDNNIILKDIFFLKSYLSEFNNPELNDEFLILFDKAVHLNEKIALLEYLLINGYDKTDLKKIINLEFEKSFDNYSKNDVEGYKYDLNEILRQLKIKN